MLAVFSARPDRLGRKETGKRPSTLAPNHLDAGSRTFPSRFRSLSNQPCGLSRAGYIVRELPTLRYLGAVPPRVRVMGHPVTSLASA